MKTDRLLLVVTFMSLFLFGTSLYGQQEVDPTWYNPWPEATKTATAPLSQAVKAKDEPKVVTRSADKQTKVTGAKKSGNQQTTLRADVQNSSEPGSF